MFSVGGFSLVLKRQYVYPDRCVHIGTSIIIYTTRKSEKLQYCPLFLAKSTCIEPTIETPFLHIPLLNATLLNDISVNASMEAPFPNQSHQHLYITYSGTALPDTAFEDEVNVTRTASRLTSPLATTVVVLVVFVFSSMVLIGNSLLLIAMYRFKRLRTPSNYLVMSLATSDLGIGMFMPVGVYLELGGATNTTNGRMCLISYGIAISLCCVSILVMVAIAVDRFTSLARPLRYNNVITHTAIERYIVVFWIYSFMVGFTPLGFNVVSGMKYSTGQCSFGGLVAKSVQLFMFCAVYGPGALVLLVCYGYIYFVARGHARAISEVRYSLRYSPSAGPPRYGLAIAITTGMFLGLWMPFQLCMLIDVFWNTNILSDWIAVYLSLPILASSALNPWVYGYRNSELRCAVRRVIDDLLTILGFTYRSRQLSDPMAPSAVATAGDHASFIHHVQRDCLSWRANENFILVPIAKPESSGVASECSETPRIFRDNQKIYITTDTPQVLRESRSMVETFAVARGSDVLIIKGNLMIHGASVI